MSKQRSSTSTSGRGSQSGSSTRTTSGRTTQDQAVVGTPMTGGGSATGGAGTTEQGMMEKAQQVAGQVQQKATQRVESGLARGKTQAAETLNTVAQSLISTGQQLRERNQEPVSRYVDQFADRVQRVSNYLQNTDITELVDRTEQFARRRPALFLGGAFALGLLGARFLKSSNRAVSGGRGATGGTWTGSGSGQGYSRERNLGVEQEVPTPRPQQEWAAGGVEVSGLADVSTPTPAQPLRDSGFNRGRDQLDFGTVAGGPEAPQR
jgi:ElaB/YqjD/DUF883 family membrane-anchored ribosome-binding protein